MALEMVGILGVRDVNPTVKTFVLNKRVEARPGQFCMLWIPGVGEKPFGFAKLDGDVEVMVRRVGGFTEKMFSLGAGDLIGFRGPYGDGYFRLTGEKICVVAGGVGLAPLLPLVEIALSRNLEVTVIHGAKTKEELIPLERLEGAARVILSTDDGSCGEKGSACDVFKEVVGGGVDQVFTCGPELMMKGVMDTALRNKIPCQLSMERYIKCGIGVCGHCSIDDSGLMVCRDGPVFDAETLRGSEFGRYRRDESGSVVDL